MFLAPYQEALRIRGQDVVSFPWPERPKRYNHKDFIFNKLSVVQDWYTNNPRTGPPKLPGMLCQRKVVPRSELIETLRWSLKAPPGVLSPLPPFQGNNGRLSLGQMIYTLVSYRASSAAFRNLRTLRSLNDLRPELEGYNNFLEKFRLCC